LLIICEKTKTTMSQNINLAMAQKSGPLMRGRKVYKKNCKSAVSNYRKMIELQRDAAKKQVRDYVLEIINHEMDFRKELKTDRDNFVNKSETMMTFDIESDSEATARKMEDIVEDLDRCIKISKRKEKFCRYIHRLEYENAKRIHDKICEQDIQINEEIYELGDKAIYVVDDRINMVEGLKAEMGSQGYNSQSLDMKNEKELREGLLDFISKINCM